MKEFLEKLNNRISEKAHEAYGYTPMTRVISERELKDTITNAAEEYNNGWIACELELPFYTGYYLVTIKGFNRPMYAWWLSTEKIWQYLNSTKVIEDVIAWKPLPEPYQQKKRIRKFRTIQRQTMSLKSYRNISRKYKQDVNILNFERTTGITKRVTISC